MKITIIYQYFGSENSLWSTRWYDFCNNLSKDNEVTIVTSNFVRSDLQKVKFYKKIKMNNFFVEIFPFGDGNNYTLFRRYINSILFTITISFRLFFKKSDLYIFSSGPITAVLPMLFKSRKKCILEVRDLWPDGGFEMNKIPKVLKLPLFYIQKKIYKKPKKIIVCSPAQKDYINNQYHEENFNIDVIEHGIDSRVLSNAKQSNTIKKNYWVVVATLGYIHNPEKWLDLAKKMKTIDDTINIVLVGSGPLFEKIKIQKETLRLQNVILTGQLQKIKLSEWISKAEFCLFSTIDNKIQRCCAPNKIYDYIALEKPILIDLDMWILSEYEKVIFKFNFNNFNANDLKKIRTKKEKLKSGDFREYKLKLNRNNLSELFLK